MKLISKTCPIWVVNFPTQKESLALQVPGFWVSILGKFSDLLWVEVPPSCFWPIFVGFQKEAARHEVNFYGIIIYLKSSLSNPSRTFKTEAMKVVL